ncbi:ABC transporter ATP-binding protein [Trinickia caryophylli]|uniref:Peptide/nickel transport system ATP-binding protein n=1 Tax=Trinickia caryophylli TaxID=28094 RepID=A0A1X7D250_TRICW|nr:ABC transporter ATP-binding protein [Trinickia caryophylli]PMS12804.1 ABC transporter ATP-binding protein [Trinickia caryophylli]TRX15223.1 ABC transporter ATP-binding protein [Trinickia caryophylli]WQE15095.1 ABC transporter ATP-binding protein [Trinickia caryophylli]SMF07348.1 peptide/nickel transport system ATP-binding protein [Trinickia caryophylli]GLU31170.1 peptide ABC transporter ATP-binding protein [Trinickia caryophylli]
MNDTTMIEVDGLRIEAGDAPDTRTEIVKGVSFRVNKGEVLALIGESGSGKTTIALSLLGYARQGCAFAGGSVRVGGTDVLALDEAGRRALRARTVAYVAQSAAAGFNPARRLMDQVTEPALLHGLMTREAAEAKAVELFRALALPAPETLGERYAHQVSGGQLQRLMAAMALITDPAVVVFDEPTTALDVTTQIEVLVAFKRVIKQFGATAVYVSHDLAVVAQMADRIVVLNGGQVQENGTVDQILDAPAHPYTRALLNASRHRGDGGRATADDAQPHGAAATPLLEVRGLCAGYGGLDRKGQPAHRVLDDVGLTIGRGRAVGVIGESGSGKTTLARVVAGLVGRAGGEVRFEGQPLPAQLAKRTPDQYRRIQIVFQNADTALNPSHTVADILSRPLAFYHGLRGPAAKRRVAQLLDLVKLPASAAARLSSELSGGQKQRVNLARALAAEPALILCDEVTSALDTVVAAAIVDLLGELRRELGVSYLFISHDISTVRAICDEVVVLYAGRRVEAGQRASLGAPPHHPYTGLLVDSVPQLKRGWLEARRELATAIPAPLSSDAGHAELCCFRARCGVRIDGRCNVSAPSPKRLDSGTEILCHRSAEELVRLQPAGGAM